MLWEAAFVRVGSFSIILKIIIMSMEAETEGNIEVHETEGT